jgi:eukaryotic-like serine/threonine-protein kinase
MDRWSVIEEIFQSAVERPLSERNAYVAQACGDDAELRQEIDPLLASAGNATSALDSVVAGDLREMVQSSEASEIGLRVGPYRLMRELDGGGMGVVYLGVRSDDQYFQLRESAADVGILIDGVEGWMALRLPLEMPETKPSNSDRRSSPTTLSAP